MIKDTSPARILADNAAFEQASPSEKRKIIAADVLERIASGRLRPGHGWLEAVGNRSLFESLTDGWYRDGDINDELNLRDVLAQTPKCTGCALGGIFMCVVERIDAITVSKGYEEIEDVGLADSAYLLKFFTSEQLKLIEIAYEEGCGMYSSHGVVGGGEAANFCSSSVVRADRMRLIMENIIANDGRFIPGARQTPIVAW